MRESEKPDESPLRFFHTCALTVHKKVAAKGISRPLRGPLPMFDRRKIPRRHVSFRTVGKAEERAKADTLQTRPGRVYVWISRRR